MNFAREKRLLLGWAALVVALPLPLTDTLDWPSLVLFLLAVSLFLRHARTGSERWLSNRVLNVLGLVYLPLLLLDLAAFARTQPVRPILHLTLFGVAAKLWSLKREKDKWQAWIGIFFLFLAAMATSTHPSVVIYLFAFLVYTVVLLVRFVHLHVLSAFAGQRAGAVRLGAGRSIAVLALATALLAVPLFALLPRVRSPFVVGPGGLQSGPFDARMGYSEEMTLDRIGRMRSNPEVALRLSFEGRYPAPAALRLRGAVYEGWEGRSWKPAPGGRMLRGEGPPTGLLLLAPGREVGVARLSLEPLGSTHLFVPVEAVALEPLAIRLTLSDGGAVALPIVPQRPLDYVVRLGSEAVSPAPPLEQIVPGSEVLSVDRVTPALAALAGEWAGVGSAAERAARIEHRFHTEFTYATDTVGRGGEDPIEAFLLRDRRGHCEYFASAMVLLLRAQGIPARLATGFYGAEWSRWEGSWVVRQSNAHAWVEAWIPDRGWTIFDPTPPAGRPAPAPTSLLTSMRQAWEAAVYRWDRWVISYDFDDQVGAMGSLRAWWGELMRRLAGGRPESPAAPPPAPPTPGGEAAGAGEGATARRWMPLLAGGLVLLVGLAIWLLTRRPAWTAQGAYALLRATLVGAGLPVADALPPLALARLVERRLPEASPAADRVIALYVREVFAGRPAAPDELAGLRAEVAAVEQAARRARRKRRAA